MHLVSFLRVGKSSAVIYQIYFQPPSVSFSETPIMQMLFSQKFPKLLIFFHVFSFPFGSLPLFYLPGHLCVLLYDLSAIYLFIFCYLFLIECFSLQLLYSSVHFLLISSSFLL